MRSASSGLSTRGRCVLAAGAACAVCALVLDERDLLRIGALLLALPVMSALVCRLSPLRLQISRTVAHRPLAVETLAQVELQLRARSRTPAVGLVLQDRLPPSCGTGGRYTIGRMRAGAAVTLHYPFTPRLRGTHQLGPLQVYVADPLGLVELTRTVGEPTAVLVRPRVDALSGRSPLAAEAEHGGAHRTSAPTVRDAQLRVYLPGDDTRSIHWPSTARRDELMVRTAQGSRQPGAVIMLDTRRCAHDDPGVQSSLERAVSLTASIAAHLYRVGLSVRVLTTDGVQLPAADAGLDALAVLNPSDRVDLGGVARLVGRDALFAVFGELDERAASALLDGARSGTRACLIHTLPSPGVAMVAAAGWTVIDGDEPATMAALGATLGRLGAVPR